MKDLLRRLFRKRPVLPIQRPDIDSVFSLSAVPSGSYVSRSGRRELDQIEDAITARGKTVVVLGPAKVGKSVFVNKVVRDRFNDRPIEISGRSTHSVEQFWLRLVVASGGFVEEKITQEEDRAATVEARAKLRLGHDLMKVSADLRSSMSAGSTTTVERRRLYDLQSLGENFLSTYSPVILFEDFHEIPSEDVRLAIASISKEFSEKEKAKFVFVATSEPEIRMFGRDKQLRASIYVFPSWTVAELEAVISAGLSRLNCQINQPDRNRLTRESFGSPYILNDICATMAKSARRRVGEAWGTGSSILIQSGDVAEALSAQVVEYRSFADLPNLALQQSTVADRPTRYTIGDAKGTIYHLILEALRRPGHAEPQGVGQEVIRNKIREILKNESWQSPTLGDHLAALASTDIQVEHRKLFERLPERPMTYDGAAQKFFVNDPTLRTYLYRQGRFHYL